MPTILDLMSKLSGRDCEISAISTEKTSWLSIATLKATRIAFQASWPNLCNSKWRSLSSEDSSKYPRRQECDQDDSNCHGKFLSIRSRRGWLIACASRREYHGSLQTHPRPQWKTAGVT